ncbi:MAG TPA: hypothetical protein PLH29_01335 [bacterium]|nr:hypothetical protein [bacterium]
MSHQCKAILIHCMDFRLIEQTRNWMKENGYLGDCDVVSLAGASKELVDGGHQTRELILKQINTACSLHSASEVILLHHSDCGAYKASYNFENVDEETAKQTEDMDRAEEIIKERFKDIKVKKVWAKMLDEHGEKVGFEIL